jgi:hypothetical protein
MSNEFQTIESDVTEEQESVEILSDLPDVLEEEQQQQEQQIVTLDQRVISDDEVVLAAYKRLTNNPHLTDLGDLKQNSKKIVYDYYYMFISTTGFPGHTIAIEELKGKLF